MRGIWCASLSGEREAEKLRDVLQKFLQALARWVLDQHLRIAIFRNPAFVDKDQARSYFLGKTDFVSHDLTIVIPSSARSCITFSTSWRSSGSRAEVGSSNSIIFGFTASARAIATRCC